MLSDDSLPLPSAPAAVAGAPSLCGAPLLTTLPALLLDRAAALPDQPALIELNVDGTERARLTFAGLLARARAIALRLASLRSGAPEPRTVVLSVQRNLDFLVGLSGIFLAGGCAVPVVPPIGSRHAIRARSILARHRFQAILTDRATAGAFVPMDAAASLPPLFLVDDLVAETNSSAPLPDAPPPGDLALVQYTSGSTREPQGVMLTHANFLANLAAIRRAMALRFPAGETMVSWLPPYHDMGLVGMFLNVTYLGATLVALPANAFLRRPLIWLETLSRYRGTLAGAPDFAYALCTEAARTSGTANLDLSSWRVAFNGSEPVRPATLSRFAETFAPAGLPRGALYPCYGMAEAVLMATGSRVGADPVTVAVSRRALRRNRIEPPAGTDDTQLLAASGRSIASHDLVAVAPDTAQPLLDGAIGELLFRGPSVAQGYFGAPAATAASFGLAVDGLGGGFFRTGDLGFIRDGHVFITGRVKDLVIVNGENHHPHDLEASLGDAAPELRADACCAFSDDTESGERLIVVASVRATLTPEHLAGLAAAMQETLAREHGLRAAAIVLVKPGALPRTTSGKLQRALCRAQLRDGALPVLFRQDYAPVARANQPPDPPDATPLDRLSRIIAALAGVSPADFDASAPLEKLGLDSVDRVRLLLAIEDEFGVRFSAAAAPTWRTAAELLDWLATAAPAAPTAAPAPAPAPLPAASDTAAAAQAALWRDAILAPYDNFQQLSGLSFDSPVQVLRIALAMEQFPAIGRDRSLALAVAWVRREQLAGWFFHVPRVQPLLADPARSAPVIWAQLQHLAATAPSPAIVSLFHTNGWDWLLALLLRAATSAGRRVAVLYDAAVAELNPALLQRFEILIGRSAAQLRHTGAVTLTDIRDRSLDFHLLRHLDEGRLIVAMSDAVHGSRPRPGAIDLPLLGGRIRVAGGIYRIAGARRTPLLNLALAFADDGPHLAISHHPTDGFASASPADFAAAVTHLLAAFSENVARDPAQWRQWRALVPAPVAATPAAPGAPLLDRDRVLVLDTGHLVWLMCRASQRTLALPPAVFRLLASSPDVPAFRDALAQSATPLENLDALLSLLTGRDPHALFL